MTALKIVENTAQVEEKAIPPLSMRRRAVKTVTQFHIWPPAGNSGKAIRMRKKVKDHMTPYIGPPTGCTRTPIDRKRPG